MDDRQSGIKEGAGLEDSRVNQEFVDFLKKWSSPVLWTLVVASLVWAGLQYLERKKITRVEQAFSELAAATQGGNPSPASLKTLAAEYAGVRSVPELALLTTAELYLNAFVIGFEPGAQINPATGLPIEESDILDEDQRQVYLEQAGQIAQQVLDIAGGIEGKELIAMQAMSRLAAVEEGKRDFDGAKSMYQQLESLANASAYPAIARFASARVENLGRLEGIVALPSEDAFAPLPGEQISNEQIQRMIDSINNQESDSESDLEIGSDDEASTDDAEETPAESEAELPTESEDAPAEESESP